jgi:hypothetical protein
LDPTEFVAHQYEAGTGFAVGDRVHLTRTSFAPPGAPGLIVGVDVDLRDDDGHASSDPCFRVLLNSGAIVYVTSEELLPGEGL